MRIDIPEYVRVQWDEAIARGMEFLDGYFDTPEWVDRIDLDKLELDCVDSCVCGQLFDKDGKKVAKNGYDYAVQYVIERDVEDDMLDVFRPGYTPGKLGFFLPDVDVGEAIAEYNNLDDQAQMRRLAGVDAWDLFTQHWITAIEKRRANL